MIWHKKFGYNHLKNLDYLLASIIVMIFIGFFYRQPVFYAMIGIVSTYLLFIKIYDRFIDKKLNLVNEQTTVRLFQGDVYSLTFVLQNKSLFPMLNGNFTLQTDPTIQVLKHDGLADKKPHEWSIVLSMMGKGQTEVEVPVQAKQRGVGSIKQMIYTFPHLFYFDRVTLSSVPNDLTEVIVFPQPIPVQGVASVFQMSPGFQQINLSPFEDVQSPLGTRDYRYSDPFYRINWKASLKAQQLQTNEYDKVIDRSVTFIVNIGSKQNITMVRSIEDTEKLLSYTTYLCQYATNKGIPYDLYMNARKPGKVPYIHLPAGEGKSYYSHTLEMLARIPRQSLVVPFHHMIYQVGQQLLTRKTIILIGEITEESHQMIKHWKRRQHNIFYIKTIDDVAMIKQWGVPDEK